MKISYVCLGLMMLASSPAMAQEIMTFGHEAPVTRQTYKRTQVPRGSTLVVKSPDECSVPTNFIGQSIQTLNNMHFNKPVRIIRPGDPMTMDHNPQRLNIMLDENDIILNIMCG